MFNLKFWVFPGKLSYFFSFFYFFLWFLRYNHNKDLDYYDLEFIKDALLTQVRAWRFKKKKKNENKQFTFFWALYLSIIEGWQKSYSRLRTLDIMDTRSLAAAFSALDKLNASQKSPLSSLEGEVSIGNKPFALLACFCNTWQAEKIKKAPFLSLDLNGIKRFALLSCCVCSSWQTKCV